MDKFQRIVKILAHLSVCPEGVAGGDLAKLCGVPWTTMQGDLEVIARTYPVFTDADELDTDDEVLQPDVNWFVVPGFEAYLPITLGVEDLLVLHKALELVGESAERAKLQQRISLAFDLAQDRDFRYVKGNMDPIQPIDTELFPLLEMAIHKRRQLTFNSGGHKACVDPLGIIFYSKLRCWYLVARDKDKVKTYNLQNLSSIRLTDTEFDYPQEFNLRDWMSPRWGMEYGEPMQVKVRFTNRSQTFAKVRKDTAHRDTKLIEGDNGQTLIMEDTVIGLNEFIAWVLGFGSAAEVLEPPELREAVMDRVKQALAVYGL